AGGPRARVPRGGGGGGPGRARGPGGAQRAGAGGTDARGGSPRVFPVSPIPAPGARPLRARPGNREGNVARRPAGWLAPPAVAASPHASACSRRRAVLSQHQNSWLLPDLHSSRGTYTNGARIPAGHDVPLQEGDQIQLGDTLLAFVRRVTR